MDFEVRRDDLGETRFVESEPPELEPGQALLAVDTFGLSTNNITYAVLGEAVRYWNFFPASEEGWGRMPVWGFADVAEGNDGLQRGMRVFGYLPPSTHLVVAPEGLGESGFVDASPHRADLPAVYNRYSLVEGDATYEARYEDQQMLLFPLFFTSWLIDDFLADEGFFGAETMVLSSASSKTASGLAFPLSRRDGVEVVGLTSPRSLEFVEGLGVYDRVLSYDEVDSLEQKPTVYVDMSGDADVREAVHRRLGDALAHSSVVGMTHREEMGSVPDDLPGPRPKVFFAPDRIVKRGADWGPGGLQKRFGEAWRPYVEWTTGWLEVSHGRGPEEVERVYRELLEGRVDPAVGQVLSLSS